MRAIRAMLSALVAGMLAVAAASAQAAAPMKIRVAWTVPIANWASILAEKKDLARHLGKSYDLEPVHFSGTPQMITALATGDIEIADLAYSSLALAIENAGMADLRVISDEVQDGVEGQYSQEIMVRSDSDIKTIEGTRAGDQRRRQRGRHRAARHAEEAWA
jgi:sulfonate transport system substrate-binding protein